MFTSEVTYWPASNLDLSLSPSISVFMCASAFALRRLYTNEWLIYSLLMMIFSYAAAKGV